jgi:hypothetical protein
MNAVQTMKKIADIQSKIAFISMPFFFLLSLLVVDHPRINSVL